MCDIEFGGLCEGTQPRVQLHGCEAINMLNPASSCSQVAERSWLQQFVCALPVDKPEKGKHLL
jgi:hypothetical protein